MTNLNDIIKLSVGGQDFKTTRRTLVSDKNSKLARIFKNTEDSGLLPANVKFENGTYFIDRDPKVCTISHCIFKSFQRTP